MRTRLLAAAILFCVYIGAPFVAPNNHTVHAARYCFCGTTADMYENNGGAYLGQQTDNFNLGMRDTVQDCANACWAAAYNWGMNTVCPSGDIQYLTLTGNWTHFTIPNPPQGTVGPTNVGCP